MRQNIRILAGLILGVLLLVGITRADSPALQKSVLLDVPVTSAADVLTSSLTPGSVGYPSTTITVLVKVDDAATVSLIAYAEDADGTATGVGQAGALNQATALTADCWYSFTIPWASAWSLNVQSDTTTRMSLIVDEIEIGAR